MKNNLFNRPLAIALAIVSTLLAGPLSAAADTLTWIGGSGTSANWSDLLNWVNSASANAVPVAGDNLIFSGSAQTFNNNDLSGLASGWLQFVNGDFSLSGNPLTLSSGITNAAGDNSFNPNLTLGAPQNFESQSGTLIVYGGITNNGFTLSVSGGGNTTLSNMVSGAGGLVMNGSGTLTLGGLAANNNTFTGGLTVNSGTVFCSKLNGSTYGSVGNGSVVVNNGAIITCSGDNSFAGTAPAASRTLQINSGGTVNNVSTATCHLPTLILNGGTLFGASANGTWGDWNLDQGVLTLTNGSISTIDGGNITLGQTGGAVFNIGAGDTVIVSSVIAHTTSAADTGLIKTGAGLLELSADNTYTSATTISNGTLRVDTATALTKTPIIRVVSGGVLDVGSTGFSVSTNQTLAGTGTVIGTVNDNDAAAAITLGGAGAAGTLTIDTLMLSGNLVLNIDLANVTTVGGGVNDLLVVTNLTLAASGTATNTISFNFLNATPVVGGVYTLIKYTTYSGPAALVDTLASAPTRYTFTFTNDTSVNAIKVIVGGNPASLVWKGDGVTNNWDILTTRNWLKSGSPDYFYQADIVTFDDTGSSSAPVQIVGQVQPTTVTVNSSANYTFSGGGSISGSPSLTKLGSGALTINNANTSSGTTTVNGGSLNLQVANALSGPLTLNAGAVNVNAATAMPGQSTINGGTLTVNAASGAAGAINTVNNGGNLVLAAGGSSGSAGGTININAGGTTTLVAGNALGYSGTYWVRTLNINGGLVDQRVNADNGWGITINMTGGELRANGGVAYTGGPYYSLGGGSAINTLPNATSAVISGRINLRESNPGNLLPITVADGTADADLLVSGAITTSSASYGLSKNGPGKMVFTGPNNYSSATFINAGTLQVGTGGTSGLIGTGVISNNAALIFNRSDTLTVSPSIFGTGTLEQAGTGALLLNGLSGYTGNTTVSAGTLQGTGTISNSPITVLSGANLSAGGVLATGTLTTTNITLNPGAGLVFDLSSTAATSDLINDRGTLTLDPNGTPVTFNFLGGGTPYTGGAYTIVSNLLARTGTLSYVNPTRYSALFDYSNPTRIQVSFTGTGGNLVWNGNLNNKWNFNTDANWLNGGVASTYLQADAVIFDATGASQPNVTLAGTMTPASVTVEGAGNYSFSGGAIAGIGNLTKSGSGTLTVSNNLAYTGTTSIGAGTLVLGNGSAVAGNIVDQGALVINRSDAYTYAGVIGGQGTVTINGSGTFTQLGANTLIGPTFVNSGVLQFGAGLNAGLSGPGPITVTSPGTLTFYRNDSPNITSPLSGNGVFNFIGTGLQGQSSFELSATNTFTGTVNLTLARLWPNYGAVSLGSLASLNVQPGAQIWAVNNSGNASPTYNAYNIPLTLAGTGWFESAGYLGAMRMGNGANWAGPITLAANARISPYTDANSNVITGTITGGYELETGTTGGTGLMALAPSSPNSFAALRVSPGTVVMANPNALSNNIPLTMNGGTLKLNGFNRTFAPFTSLSTSSSIQNLSTTSPANVTLVPLINAVFSYGTFADLGVYPLNVTLNQSGPFAAVTLGGASSAWTGNFTNNGGTLNVGGQNTYLGVFTLPTRTLTFNNTTMNWTINNITTGGNFTEPTIVLNNSTINSTRYNALGPIVLNGSTLTGADSADGTYYQWVLPGGSVTVTGSAPSYMLGSGTSYGYCLATPTVFNVADVTGSSAPDLTVSAPLRTGGSGIGGTGALIKTGAGTMLVTDVATYTGYTLITNGVLAIGASGSIASSSSIIVGSGATLDVSAAGLTLGAQTLGGSGTVTGNVTDGAGSVISPGSSVGTLTFNGSLSLGGSGSLAVDLANTTTVGGGVNDLIQVNGDLSLNDAAPTAVNFNFLNGAPAAGTYTLIKYTGNLTGSAAGLTNSPARYAVTYILDAAHKAIQVTFSGSPTNLVWTGTDPLSPATWDVGASTNWFDGTGGNVFYEFDTVRFDDSQPGVNTTVSLISTVTPSGITVDSTNAYSITGNGVIAGSTGIIKNNTNTLTLGTANTFSGPVQINGGKLVSGNNNALPVGAVVTVASGAGYDMAGFGNSATRAYSFSIAGSGPDGSGAIVNSGAAIQQNASISNLTLTADAVIGGSGRWDIGTGGSGAMVNGNGHTLTKVGSFAMSMRQQLLTNVASIIVSNGSTWYENFSQTNSWTATTTNFVRPGAALGIYGGQTINVPVALDAATIQNQGSGTPTWIGPVLVQSSSIFSSSGAQNFYGVISGPGGMFVSGGTGALTISNANTYAGGTVISNAVVTPTNNAAAGTAAIIVAQPNALGSGPVTIDASLESLVVTTNNTLTNVVRALEFNLTGGSIVPNAINLPVASSLVTNVSLQGRDSTSVFTLSGQIGGGYVGLTNWFDSGTSGSLGVTRLANNANNFLSSSIRVSRGTLAITGDGCLGNSANLLRMDQAVANINGAALRFDAPSINLAHPVLVASATVFDLFGDNNGDGVPETVNNATVSGILSGAGTIYVRGTNGTLTLSGANTYSLGFELQQPVTLQVSASANLGTAYLGIKAGSTFRYTGTGSETMTRTAWIDTGGPGGGGTIDIPNASASLTWNPGAGTINQNLTKTGLGALTLGSLGISGGLLTANGGTLTVNSVISGATVVQVNTGTLRLAGANTYVGPTLVNGGTLFVNGSLPAANAVTVASGATLGGTGTINCPVTLQAGSFFQPGAAANTIGTLTIKSPLALAGSTTMEINGTTLTSDAVVGMSTVTYGGTLTVNNLGGDPPIGAKFTLFSAVDRLGSFTTSPALPSLGVNKAWVNNLAVDGSIQVAYTGSTTPPTLTSGVVGTNLVLSWPTDHIGWKLLVQTNNLNLGVSTSPADWGVMAGSSTTNQVSIPIDAAKPTEFYRLVSP